MAADSYNFRSPSNPLTELRLQQSANDPLESLVILWSMLKACLRDRARSLHVACNRIREFIKATCRTDYTVAIQR